MPRSLGKQEGRPEVNSILLILPPHWIMRLQQFAYHKYLFTLVLWAGLSLTALGQDYMAATHFTDTASVNPAPGRLPSLNLKKRAERQQLLRFLKTLKVPEASYNEPEVKQWSRLAQVFTHLRLYPLAMKCYLKTLTPDSLTGNNVPVTDSDQWSLESQLKPGGYPAVRSNSPIIKVDSIIEKFNDGKQALAYAMILHIKQPVRGTPKVHKLIYTGHTFITLIKFNTDYSYAVLSFGFGPHKDNLLAATPLMPSSSSKFTDDGSHAWDEVVGKFITKRRFEKILQLTRQYEGLAYNLSTNNCTDFGLKAARLAGLEVRDTKGSWPLGHGNNPGVAGESILLGKYSNTDTGNGERLFIDTLKEAPLPVKPQ